jgi:hypothetical protein
MKKLLTIIMFCGGCYGYAQKTPPHAASTQAWTFGNSSLMWSDAIHVPECNKETFEESLTKPQCRSYTSGTSTWYYYNWLYVNANAATLCPQPWRVPTRSDFDALVGVTTSSALADAWVYGGAASGGSMSNPSFAYYWSSTVYPSDTNFAYYLLYYSGNLNVIAYNKYYGFQVRCVK